MEEVCGGDMRSMGIREFMTLDSCAWRNVTRSLTCVGTFARCFMPVVCDVVITDVK